MVRGYSMTFFQFLDCGLLQSSSLNWSPSRRAPSELCLILSVDSHLHC